jgi:hypothetical protein
MAKRHLAVFARGGAASSFLDLGVVGPCRNEYENEYEDEALGPFGIAYDLK